jgi:hydroxypyruvate reductase
VISGGEVRCAVRGNGVGGRNQEFVLYSASLLAGRGLQDNAVLSCGTDGIDGNSNATGAVANSTMYAQAQRHQKDASEFINRSDSHSFFHHMGGLVVTGPTGNNARDLRILMARP